MNISREYLNWLREQYPAGSKVTLVSLEDPYSRLKPGDTGELIHIDDIGTYHIKWDNGSSLGLVPDVDRFTITAPELQSFKLYMPMTADLVERNEWGDLDQEGFTIYGRELAEYTDMIEAALVKERMPEEAECGIMHWYHDSDSVNSKVKSVVFGCEIRDGELWGVAECKSQQLTENELDTLKEYIAGQASDGWGEGFEQRELKLSDGSELYVHLWNSDDWAIQTEDEAFGQRQRGGMRLE